MSNLLRRKREIFANPSILTLASRIEEVYRETDRDEGLSPPNGLRLDAGQAEGPVDRDAAIEALQARLEAMPAGDLSEALIHAMLATARIEYLRSSLNDALAAQLVPVEKLTRSVLEVLIREVDLDLTPFGGKRYLPDRGAPDATGR